MDKVSCVFLLTISNCIKDLFSVIHLSDAVTYCVCHFSLRIVLDLYLLLRSSMWIWSCLNQSPLKRRHWTGKATHLGKFMTISYQYFNKNDVLVPSVVLDGAQTGPHSALFSFCDVVQFPLLHTYVSMFYIAILIKNWGKAGVKKTSAAKWRRRMFCLQLAFKARMSKTLKPHYFFTKELVFSIHEFQLVVCSNEMSVVLHRGSIFQERN